MTIGIMGISMIFMLLGMLVQFRLKSKFATYRKVVTSSGLSGKEVAEKMLRDNGIYDVQVTSVPGFYQTMTTQQKRRLILVKRFMKEQMYQQLQWRHMNVVMRFNMLQLTLCLL